MDISQFNADWLKAWSAKDTAGVLRHYHPDCIYKDAQVPGGLRGHDQLRAYLDGLFAATGGMRFDPDEVWETADGYCGRWICTADGPNGAPQYMRGFDLVVLKDDLIALNEVYTHALAGKPEA